MQSKWTKKWTEQWALSKKTSGKQSGDLTGMSQTERERQRKRGMTHSFLFPRPPQWHTVCSVWACVCPGPGGASLRASRGLFAGESMPQRSPERPWPFVVRSYLARAWAVLSHTLHHALPSGGEEGRGQGMQQKAPACQHYTDLTAMT